MVDFVFVSQRNSALLRKVHKLLHLCLAKPGVGVLHQFNNAAVLKSCGISDTPLASGGCAGSTYA